MNFLVPDQDMATVAGTAQGGVLTMRLSQYISFYGHPAQKIRPRLRRQPVTLLESFSPYGSRKVTVEFDGLVTAAYLYDDTAAISATWIANHRPAPPRPTRPGWTPGGRR